jgi:glycosyltransferase involved in cell wall biosynthesis
VASFHPKKKQRSFIENSLPELVEDNPGAQVAFVGDFNPGQNPHAAECQQAVEELGLADHVHFAGYRSDVERWYQAADITVLASEKEGLARSMIESIACGTPVISFDVASAREILEEHECGVVVPQRDYDGLSQAISKLWADQQRRNTMGENGASAAQKLFDPDRIVEEYEALYKEVVQEG